MSLFRGGSDVLFHPRQRQSCRTAKTYHTIVSKFAHSLISRSFSSAISLSSFLFLSRRFFFSFYDGSPAALCISLSSLVLPHHSLFFSRTLRLPLLHVFYSIHRRATLLLYLSYTQCPRRGLVVRAGQVFRRSVCAPDRKTSGKMRSVVVHGCRNSGDDCRKRPKSPGNVQVIELFISLVRIYRCKSLSE